jgi:protein-S-isoprenylcysteine O-methyltransferase Ste14
MIVIAWGYKARLEEATMLAQFGPEYERYRRDVKGLLPYVY